MSVATYITPLIPPAIDLPRQAMPPDQSTRAAMNYLLTGDAVAWKQLIEITSKATKNLFLSEPGITRWRTKLRFLELWLVESFAPYRDADADTICAAAGRGEFRYLGKHARQALIDAIRRRYRSQDALDQRLSEKEWWAGLRPRVVSLDAPLGEDDDFTLGDLLAIDASQDSTISAQPSALGRQPGLEPEELQHAMRDGQQEFKRLLGPLHDVLTTVCGLFVASPDDLHTGDAARAVAATRGISIQVARRKLRQLAAILRRALIAGNPTVRALHRMLATPGRPTFWLNEGRSGRPQAA
jgi:hypothetical protein